MYYKALEVWTDLDVRKRKMAKKNNLRLLELWDLKQVKDWLYRWFNAKRFSKNMLGVIDERHL